MKRSILVLAILLFAVSFIQAQVRIKMKSENGVYTTPCTVNGLRLRFIFDTGASNVCISLSEALFMLKNGYLSEEDLKGSSYSQIANGDVIENTTVTLKELEIGNITIYNIEAIIIHELTAPLLLGQSAIQKLGKIQLEGDELIILSAASSSSEIACSESEKLIQEATKQFSKELFSLSSTNFQKAYDLCPDAFDCFYVYIMGSAFFSCYNYPSAIKYSEKAIGCINDKKTLMYIYSNLGQSYIELKDYDKAILNFEKAFAYSENYGQKSNYLSNLALIYFQKSNYQQAKDLWRKSIGCFLKDISVTEDDVTNGRVKDEVLGEQYWNLAKCCTRLNLDESSLLYAFSAALCGDESARSYIRQYYGRSDMDFDKRR